jgi:anti-anti-sigma factor
VTATVHREWGYVRITVLGEADLANSDDLRMLLAGIAAAYPGATYIVDVRAAFLAVCALRVLVNWATAVATVDGFVAVAGATSTMRRAVRIVDGSGVLALVAAPGDPPADRGLPSGQRS